MFSKVSVLVPTRRRPMRLASMIASYDATQSGASELVFRIDDDDDVSPGVLEPAGHRVLVGKRLGGYASMATFFNELYASSTGDLLMCGNDDMIFKTPGWDQMIVDAANGFPDGLFCFGTRTHNETHYPFAVISKEAADRMGYFWHPGIAWGDIFLRDVMGHFGRAQILGHVEIAHDWIGFAPDQTFLEEHQNDIYIRDPSYWERTHPQAVAESVAKLQVQVAA
jgi:hypothetical protein